MLADYMSRDATKGITDEDKDGEEEDSSDESDLIINSLTIRYGDLEDIYWKMEQEEDDIIKVAPGGKKNENGTMEEEGDDDNGDANGDESNVLPSPRRSSATACDQSTTSMPSPSVVLDGHQTTSTRFRSPLKPSAIKNKNTSIIERARQLEKAKSISQWASSEESNRDGSDNVMAPVLESI